MSKLIAEYYRRLMEPKQTQLKGFKVTDVRRTRKVGVTARNLQELKKKTCLKLDITEDLSRINICLTDGFEIDEEYFLTLEPQTTLIICKPGENVINEADHLVEMVKKATDKIKENTEIYASSMTDEFRINIAALNKILGSHNTKTLLSRRDEHPEWFEGLRTTFQTKEAYLHRRCQDRIRGYLYKTIEQIRLSKTYNENLVARKQLQLVIVFFKLQLKKDHYFGYYFDRSRAVNWVDDSLIFSDDEIDSVENCCYEHCPCKMDLDDYERFLTGDGDDTVDAKKVKVSEEVSVIQEQEKRDFQIALKECPYEPFERKKSEIMAFCDKRGEFKCSGVWNREDCFYSDLHIINPYTSKEKLVSFSTWNLDHKIERSRTLVPQMLQTAERGEIKKEDVVKFYENLFTAKNLRLVHIMCHDKGSHKVLV
ncbi:hypothetical protein TKK_0014083 [Trichogramma kaykai]|uniref:CIDE-N domain-containing protein n=1 Tax=Trichogramma kaykai TaxID=54128 RepID=A0ABD2WFN9_9HYME